MAKTENDDYQKWHEFAATHAETAYPSQQQPADASERILYHLKRDRFAFAIERVLAELDQLRPNEFYLAEYLRENNNDHRPFKFTQEFVEGVITAYDFWLEERDRERILKALKNSKKKGVTLDELNDITETTWLVTEYYLHQLRLEDKVKVINEDPLTFKWGKQGKKLEGIDTDPLTRLKAMTSVQMFGLMKEHEQDRPVPVAPSDEPEIVVRDHKNGVWTLNFGENRKEVKPKELEFLKALKAGKANAKTLDVSPSRIYSLVSTLNKKIRKIIPRLTIDPISVPKASKGQPRSDQAFLEHVKIIIRSESQRIQRQSNTVDNQAKPTADDEQEISEQAIPDRTKDDTLTNLTDDMLTGTMQKLLDHERGEEFAELILESLADYKGKIKELPKLKKFFGFE